MAEILPIPSVVGFLDATMVNTEFGLQLEEAVIGENESIKRKTVMTSCLRQDFGVIIVAIKP